MQSRKRVLTLTFVLAIAAVLIGAAGAPAMAAETYKGFFVSLDLANTQPTGVDTAYATLIDQSGSGGGKQETARLDNDADFTWGLKLGYSWGKMGGLTLSYWSFDNEDKLDASDANNAVYPMVFGGYAYYNGGTYGLFPTLGPVVYSTSQKIQASTIDVDYYRPMAAGEKMTIKWIAGFRSASWEENREFDGLDGGGVYRIQQSNHNEADAFGVKLGAKMIFGFTDHFSMQGLYAFSFMQGNNDAEMKSRITDAFSTDDDVITSSDDNVRGEIRDYDLRAVWTWDNFDFYAGYGGQTWDGLVADPSGTEPCCDATRTVHSSRDSVAFNSIHAGVTFRFGKSK